MVFYQFHYCINGLLIKFQPFHHQIGNPGTYRSMSVKMPSSVFIFRIALGFSNIVKQYGQGHNGVISCRFKRLCRMLPYIIYMVGIILLKSAHGSEFRYQGKQDILPVIPIQSLGFCQLPSSVFQFPYDAGRRYRHIMITIHLLPPSHLRWLQNH